MWSIGELFVDIKVDSKQLDREVQNLGKQDIKLNASVDVAKLKVSLREAQEALREAIFRGDTKNEIKIRANIEDINSKLRTVRKEADTTRASVWSIWQTLASAWAIFVLDQIWRSLINLASNLNESINAIKVVFGTASKEIEDFWKVSAKTVGLSTQEFNKLATPIGAFLQNLWQGSSQAAKETINLTQKAADLASVYNTSVSDALSAIQSWLKGESNPLERFWVTLSDAAIKAYALRTWLVEAGKEMTDQQKLTARLWALYEQTSKVQWDFANTSNQLANNQRIISAQLKDIWASLWTIFLPIVNKATAWFWVFVWYIGSFIKESPKFTAVIGSLVAFMWWLVAIFAWYWLILPVVTGATAALWVSLWAILWPIGLVIAWIIALKLAYDNNVLGIRNIVDAITWYTEAQRFMDSEIKKHQETIASLRKDEEELQQQYISWKISKDEYTAATKKLQDEIKSEQSAVRALNPRYTEYTSALDNATAAKARLEAIKLNPNATVEAIRVEANAAIAAANAFLLLASAKAKALASQAWIQNFDPNKPSQIRKVDTSIAFSVQWDVALKQLNAITPELIKQQKVISDANDDIKNASKIVAGLKGWWWGGGSSKWSGKWSQEAVKAQKEEEKRLLDIKKKQDEINIGFLNALKTWAKEAKNEFDKIIDKIKKAKDEIVDINKKIWELQTDTTDNLSSRFLEIQQTIKESWSTQALQDELIKIRANVSEAQLTEATRVAWLSTTDKILEENNAKIAQLQADKILKEKEIADLEVNKIKQQAVLDRYALAQIYNEKNLTNQLQIEKQKQLDIYAKYIKDLENLDTRLGKIQVAKLSWSSTTNSSQTNTTNNYNVNVTGNWVNGSSINNTLWYIRW